jgi:hypothetical protein
MEDSEIFSEVVASFQKRYPRRAICVEKGLGSENEYVSIDGQREFCITGYCLLYNLQRLCKCLEAELI